MSQIKNQIELSTMITQLRRELTKAQQTGANEHLRFRVDEIDLEVQMVSTQEDVAGGGVKFWVIDAKGQMKVASEAVQKLRLKLKPLAPDGSDLEVGARGSKPR